MHPISYILIKKEVSAINLLSFNKYTLKKTHTHTFHFRNGKDFKTWIKKDKDLVFKNLSINRRKCRKLFNLTSVS